MKINKTNLEGVLKIKLKPFRDFRGQYIEIFNKELFKKTKKKNKLYSRRYLHI